MIRQSEALAYATYTDLSAQTAYPKVRQLSAACFEHVFGAHQYDYVSFYDGRYNRVVK